MAITQTSKQGIHTPNFLTGRYFDDAGSPAAAAINCGFVPRYVRWVNLTDRIEYEWYDGQANGTTLKTAAAGTRTLDTADVAISVTGSVVTIGAAAILQNKQNAFEVRE